MQKSVIDAVAPDAPILAGGGACHAGHRCRAASRVEAHRTEPVHFTLPGHETMMALKVANVLLTIEIDGKDQLALAKDIQRHPIRPILEHVDLGVVRKGEKVHVDGPIHVVGEAAVETVVSLENNTVELAVEATHIPERLDISVEGLQAGTRIHAGDLVLPKGAELVTEADILLSLIHISEPTR